MTTSIGNEKISHRIIECRLGGENNETVIYIINNWSMFALKIYKEAKNWHCVKWIASTK